MTAEVLDRRALGRATLARQLLLDRTDVPVMDAVGHLVGLQAQIPLNPYTALWSRLARFDTAELAELLVDRRVVRIVVMRATLHLVSADDALVLRALAQPVLDKELARHRDFGPPLVGVDLGPVLDHAQQLFAERARTQAELRAAFTEKFPDLHAGALAYACRNHLALVQVPPRGVWGQSGQVRSTTVEEWLGRSIDPAPSLDQVVLRYLTAFGPSTAADIAAWSALTGTREVVDRLRPQLRVFRDERGRELVDVPDAPRPDADTPAPTRFLPEYDNVLIAHADRTRFALDGERKRLDRVAAERTINGSVIHDGELRAVWWRERDASSGAVTLTVAHVRELAAADRDAIETEARALLRFIAADAAGYDVVFQQLDAA